MSSSSAAQRQELLRVPEDAIKALGCRPDIPKLAGEAARVPHDDGRYAVVLDPIQQIGETLTPFDGIGAVDGRVVVLGDELETSAFGVALDGGTLPLVRILISADVCRRRGT